MADTTSLALRLNAGLSRRLDKLAKTTQREKSALALQAIREFVRLTECHIAGIKKGLREADAGDFATDDEVEAMFKKWSLRSR